MSNINETTIRSGKAIGGCNSTILMYSAQSIGNVEYDSLGVAVIEVESQPLVLVCAHGSVSFQESWEDDEQQGGYYKVSVRASISRIQSITSSQLSQLSIHRWVAIIRLFDGQEKVFGLDIPLKLSYQTSVTADYKGNVYEVVLSGVSSHEAPLVSNVLLL